ncbi:helix-turn-helix domain-containing protein [Microbispora rosea]|uniref:AlbA family DNA-binding domain-containing protein n=1 Tax=Microbispora rosea TaxID=58117 RepID=UPI0036987527
MRYRSRRLDALLGVSLGRSTFADWAALEDNPAAAEAEDLDYKIKYEADKATGDSAADSIAIDVATFANHVGGVIVVGMAEVDLIPSKALKVDLSEKILRTYTDAVAAKVSPLPLFDVVPLEDPDTPGTGLILIAVPPSPRAPHCVIINANSGVTKWPRRVGAQKVWLSEAEIYAAYQRRFTGIANRAARMTQVEADVIRRLVRNRPGLSLPQPVLIVSMVPDLPGDMTINSAALADFRADLADERLLPGALSPMLTNQTVGPRRLIGYEPHREGVAWAEFHADGSASIAIPISRIIGSGASSTVSHVHDAEIVLWIVGALRLMARHATEKTATTGTATLSARLLADVLTYDTDDVELGQMISGRLRHQEWGGPAHLQVVTWPSIHGAPLRPIGDGETSNNAYAEWAAILEDLAADGRPLTAAAAELASALFQNFGAAEALQIWPDGTVNPTTWGDSWATAQRWVEESNIPCSTQPPIGAGADE